MALKRCRRPGGSGLGLLRERVEEMGEVEVPPHVDEVPVVDAGPAHTVLVDPEAERPDEVERRGRGRAEPGDVARVGRDLGLDEDDVERPRERGGAEPRCGVGGSGALLCSGEETRYGF